MAYKVIILYQLYMPSYFLGTFTEYPKFTDNDKGESLRHVPSFREDNRADCFKEV